MKKPIWKNICPRPDYRDLQAVPWCFLFQSCKCKGFVLTSPMKSMTELKSKETGKSSITVSLETKQYISVSKLPCFGLCILRGNGFVAFSEEAPKGNLQNKEVKFTVRIKEQFLKSHVACRAHLKAVSGELLNCVSYLQHQSDCAAEIEDEVDFNTFYAMYCLVKHCIANKHHVTLTSWLWSYGF